MDAQAGASASLKELVSWPCTMRLPIALPAWQGPLCQGLRNVLANAPAEAHLFPRVLAHSARYGNELVERASNNSLGRDLSTEEFPLATFLLSLRERPKHRIAWTLSWLALEAHLSGGREKMVLELTGAIRGLRGHSKLNETVGDCAGPSLLLAKMLRLRSRDSDLGITGHKTFDPLWKSELEAYCHSLFAHDERGAPAPDELVDSPLHLPSPLTEAPGDQPGEDPDEGPYCIGSSVDVEQVIRSSQLRSAMDWSAHMSRQGSPDLLRPQENVLPADLRERAWELALSTTQFALRAKDVLEAELGMLEVLAIEVGLSSREALRIGFGPAAASGVPVIDLAIQAFRRPEVLPPNYFLPQEGDSRWLPTGGDIIFPLSGQCVDLLEQLLRLREEKYPDSSQSLLLGADARSLPNRVRDCAKSAYRLSLAIHLAGSLGIDAAQRAFGDTFGLSTAATFYGAHPAAELARAVESANNFSGPGLQTWVGSADHWLGSRVRPIKPPYAEAWSRLAGDPHRGKGRPSEDRLLQDWQRRRDRLLVHFLLATGHRPNNSVLELTLHDFIPRHALAIAHDKQADPAHATRLVCTGWRFVGELEGYVDELRRIAKRSNNRSARLVADSVLAGASPLFELPADAGQQRPCKIRETLTSLSQLWGDRPNVHRHGLCQFLIQERVDPELRYFQMGWLSHAHHATSDSAPHPAYKLGHELAPLLDKWLDQSGWEGGTLPKDPAEIVPLLPLCDWSEKHVEHDQAIARAYTVINVALSESMDRLKPKVLEVLKAGIELVLPEYRITLANYGLALTPARLGERNQPNILRRHVEAILAPFAKRPYGPDDRYVAARLLREGLLRVARLHNCRVHLPQVPFVSRHQVRSPFLRGLGIAVAQMDAVQAALIKKLATAGQDGPEAIELAAMTALSLLMHSTCSAWDEVLDVLRSLDSMEHANNQEWNVRVPFQKGHAMLYGDSAILAVRLVQKTGWKQAVELLAQRQGSRLASFIAELVPSLSSAGVANRELLQRFIATGNTSKLVLANGPERLVISGAAIPAAVSCGRAIGVIDELTTPDPSPNEDESPDQTLASPPMRANPAHRALRHIAEVMRAFDHDFSEPILGQPAEPPNKRRLQLRRLVEDALARAGTEPTKGRLLLEYVWHLLRLGGPRSAGGQALSTIRKTYHRIEPVLRELEPDEPLTTLSEDEVTALCSAAFNRSKRSSHQQVVEELRRFFRFAALRYEVKEPTWHLLYRVHGRQTPAGDPAMLSDSETSRVLDELYANVLAIGKTDADPTERRYTECCLAAALLAESSGARPRSIHGLTLDDVVLGSCEDYILLRTRGRFASIKTSTAAGYIPLDGGLWRKYGSWFAGWYAKACVGSPAESRSSIPMFQIPGQPVGTRYELRTIFDRIGSLIKWSTQRQKGRTYWLRKRKVRLRHIATMALPHPRARDMAEAMRLNGHALMVTPLVSYLSEPGAYLSLDGSLQAVGSRQGSAEISGLSLKTIDGARRAGVHGSRPYVARILRLSPSQSSGMHLPEPPHPAKHHGDLSWSSVARILRALVESADTSWIADRLGTTKWQIESVLDALSAFNARTLGALGASGSIEVARTIGLSGAIDKCLVREDPRLASIATDWVSVSREAQISEGCRLYDQAAIDDLRTLCSELWPSVRLSEEQESYGVRTFTFKAGKGSAYGAWPALRWALATAWIADERLKRRARGGQM